MTKTAWIMGAVVLCVGVACGDDDGDRSDVIDESPEQTGKSCQAPADCFPDVEHDMLSGEVLCLERVREGYCTHLCETDDDCCAVEGECETELRQVCSPFESTGQRMCFLSCEGGDLRAPDGGTSGSVDEQEFCQREASRDFICRSSGGGSDNRKVCVPGDCGVGADCSSDEDCSGDLQCLSDLPGGYCGRADCAADADCPGGSVCVQSDGNTLCLATCNTAGDCSFCRHPDEAARCTDDVDLVEASGVRVCIP